MSHIVIFWYSNCLVVSSHQTLCITHRNILIISSNGKNYRTRNPEVPCSNPGWSIDFGLLCAFIVFNTSDSHHTYNLIISSNGRASDSKSEGPRFKSWMVRRFWTLCVFIVVERRIRNPKVPSSNPEWSGDSVLCVCVYCVIAI